MIRRLYLFVLYFIRPQRFIENETAAFCPELVTAFKCYYCKIKSYDKRKAKYYVSFSREPYKIKEHIWVERHELVKVSEEEKLVNKIITA